MSDTLERLLEAQAQVAAHEKRIAELGAEFRRVQHDPRPGGEARRRGLSSQLIIGRVHRDEAQYQVEILRAKVKAAMRTEIAAVMQIDEPADTREEALEKLEEELDQEVAEELAAR